MRLHGDRSPTMPQMGTTGGAVCRSGSPNEVWSYGEEVYEICKKFLALRKKLQPYTAELMQQAHEKGTPVMRTLFYEFPEDPIAWEVEDEYLYGYKYLVSPVLEAKVRSRKLYLPAGCRWKNMESGEIFQGGQYVTADAPLSVIPVFERIGTEHKRAT